MRSCKKKHGRFIDPTDSRQLVDSVPRSLLALAEWAFGPNGLPNLRILAWGDFGYYDRWVGVNKLYCRKEGAQHCTSTSDIRQSAFREVGRRDYNLREFVKKNQDMLAACPGDSLLY